MRPGDDFLRLIAQEGITTIVAEAREEVFTEEGPAIESAQVSEVMDGSTCEECARHDGLIVQVGTPEYEYHKPPFVLCRSALNKTRGNLCRRFYFYRFVQS